MGRENISLSELRHCAFIDMHYMQLCYTTMRAPFIIMQIFIYYYANMPLLCKYAFIMQICIIYANLHLLCKYALFMQYAYCIYFCIHVNLLCIYDYAHMHLFFSKHMLNEFL